MNAGGVPPQRRVPLKYIATLYNKMDYGFVVLGIVLIFVLYYFLNSDGTTVLSNKLDLSIQQPNIPVKTLGSTATSPRYSLEMWMYIYNFNGQPKYIISRDATATTVKNIGIKIDGAAPKLTVEYASTGEKKEQLITDNLPLQTWVHLIVSVDNTFVDVYVNGKLIKSFKDTIDAPSSTSDIAYGQVNCYLAKLVRTTEATDPQTAWDHYSTGNGENPLAKYLANFGLSVTLQKNNQDYSKVTVF
jgi:hypothetical protein